MHWWQDKPSEAVLDYLLDGLYNLDEPHVRIRLDLGRAGVCDGVKAALRQTKVPQDRLSHEMIDRLGRVQRPDLLIPCDDIILYRSAYVDLLDALRGLGAVADIEAPAEPEPSMD